MGRNFRYWGFLSYSHDDRRAAERLHRALESYRIPARLVGLDGPFGPVPARILPIFRDRDELKAGRSLGPEVEQALSISRSLILLCSPASAASQWVEAEVAAFERLNPDGPLFCVFLAGDPMAECGAEGCLPAAAKARFNALPGMVESGPVAVDLRPGRDGWRLAVHKIVAGLTGLPLDQLVQRDARRRHQRMAWLSMSLAAIAILLGGLAVMALKARDEARSQRAQAEGLIEFMLVDLRKRLEPAGRLDALDAVGARALSYYDEQPLDSLDPDSLGRRASALHLIGEIHQRRGDIKAARVAFANASVATAESLARDPENPERLYEHAQSVFWSGNIDWEYGDAVAAEKAFLEYERLASTLSAQDPANPKWLAEVGYAHSNLGMLLLAQGRAAQAIPYFQQSLRINRKRATLPGDADVVQLDIAQDRSGLSSAHYANRQLRLAIAERQAELDIYTRMLKVDPDNALVKERRMLSHRFMGEMQIPAGDMVLAKRHIDQSMALANEQSTLDAGNNTWQQSLAKSLVLAAQQSRYAGDSASTLRYLDRAEEIVAAHLMRDPEAWIWRMEIQESLANEQAASFLQAGKLEDANLILLASQQRLEEPVEDTKSAISTLRFRIANHAMQAVIATHKREPDVADIHWRQVVALADAGAEQLHSASAILLLDALRALGRTEDAEKLEKQLELSGFSLGGRQTNGGKHQSRANNTEEEK